MSQRKSLRSPHKAKGTKKNRKFGRNKVKCAEYKKHRKHEKSHIRRIGKHMKKYKDNSPMVIDALERYRRALMEG